MCHSAGRLRLRDLSWWIVALNLLSALTGLWWSYEWYRQGAQYVLTGKVSSGEHGGKPEAGEETPAAASLARIVRRGNSPAKAMGARNELQFCIEAVLAHVLRHKALVERLDVVYGSNASSAIVRIAARSVDGGPESRERSKVQPEAGNDDFLARPVVEGLLSRMGGVLRPLPSGFGYRLVLRAKE